MREPSLKETTVLSLILHALVFFTALLVIKKTSLVTLPSPYMVRLVSPAKVTEKKTKATVSAVRTGKKAKVKAVRKSRSARVVVVKKKAVPVKKAFPPSDVVTLEERIAAIRAKKRIRTVVALRKTVLSVKKEQKAKEVQPPASEEAVTSEGNPGGESLMAGYYSLVQERVWSEWVFPEFRTGQGLEAVVDIKVYKNGRVKIQGIKKSSGNTLFDRSVLRAISKASPLPPPPYELEIAVRFTP